MSKITTAQVMSAIEALKAMMDVIKNAKSMPNGELYSVVMDKMSLKDYNAAIDLILTTKMVKLQNNCLVWVG